MTKEQTERALKRLGDRRKELLTKLRDVDRELRPLVAEGRREGVTIRRIEAITGLSSNTVQLWGRN